MIPFTPHLAYECLEMLNCKSVNIWPEINEGNADKTINIAIQINGKTRDVMSIPANKNEEEIKKIVRSDSKAKKYIEKSIKLVHKELKSLREKKLSTSQLKKAKQQIIGQITLSEENNCNTMLGMGKGLLLYNKIDSLKETFDKINNITQEELTNIANIVFDPKQLSSLIFSSNQD